MSRTTGSQLINLYTKISQILLDYQITHDHFQLLDSSMEHNYIEFICASTTKRLPPVITDYFFYELDFDYRLICTELLPRYAFKTMCAFRIAPYLDIPERYLKLVPKTDLFTVVK